MKAVTMLALLLFASSAYGELTKEDLRTIIKEEITASEKRMKEYIDLKIETVNARIDALDQKVDDLDKSLNGKVDDLGKSLNGKVDDLGKSLNGRIDDIRTIMIALIALITAAIAVPQIIMAYKERGQKNMQTQIDQLREQIEALQNTPS